MKTTIPHFQKILFTADLSRQASHAFHFAVSLAHQHDASLTIL